ncbi:MAG: prepilin-type N-terminal cleavage/methylation domain-containing protein, partial [Candidatus Omnitrophota bacterium]
MRFLCTALFLTHLKDAIVRTAASRGPGPRRKNLFRRSRGFTFLEILLALSLVSVLAGSLYATYASGIQIHKRA